MEMVLLYFCNAINGEQIGTVGSKGLDFSEMMNYARKTGGPV